ncbi:MAG: hypothetical protein EDS66_14415 [Planctomycetota bacterium]|nr:MAG: hypothetical protein EDS66_14415 [Planctomycetota bacterium]MCQ3921345.1 hypothetical protein [Planctomycetota bacterium]
MRLSFFSAESRNFRSRRRIAGRPDGAAGPDFVPGVTIPPPPGARSAAFSAPRTPIARPGGGLPRDAPRHYNVKEFTNVGKPPDLERVYSRTESR